LHAFGRSPHEMNQVTIPAANDIPTPYGIPTPSVVKNDTNVPKWSIDFPRSPTGRYQAAIVNLGHYIIFIGGGTSGYAYYQKECHKSCDVYDARHNKWMKDGSFPSLVFARIKAKAVVANGTIIVLGGEDSNRQHLVSVEVRLFSHQHSHLIPFFLCHRY
jgi:hypothetical protein